MLEVLDPAYFPSPGNTPPNAIERPKSASQASRVSLVIGASRGIGLELARALSSYGPVYATCRSPCPALSKLDENRPSFHAVSGVDVETVEGCAPLASLPPSKIDLVVCNAGVLTNDTFSSINFSDCSWQFNTNALGPLRCIQALLPKLHPGSKVIVIGSRLGSLSLTQPSKRFMLGYRMSKCAAHMAARCLAEELRPEGIAVAVVHPGVVETEMSKTSGFPPEVTAEQSAKGIVAVAAGLRMENTGSFWNYRGEQMPW